MIALQVIQPQVRTIALFLSIVFGASAFAQQPQPSNAPDPSAQSSATQDQQDQPLETLRVNVNVVNLYFNVKDKHGRLIPDLTKDDFNIFEDGKPQTVKYFSKETDQPLTLGMLIDTSGSQQMVLGIEQSVGAQFLEQVLRPKDMAFLINFDVNVELDQDFTNNGQLLRKALNEVKINRGGGGATGIPGIGQGPFPTSNPRGTLLYDAIFLAADEKLKSEVGRKAMIILTDGEDQGSQEKIESAIEVAQKSDSMCYVLLIQDRGMYNGFGAGLMKKLAEQTGGRVIEVGNKPEKLRDALDQISNELRTQYFIGYAPTNQKRDGSYRKVEVKTKNNDYKIQARKGYYAPNK
jgi:VWFA-related protein